MKRTKRLLAAILSCAMVFALTACGGSEGAGSGSLKAIPKEDLKIGFVYVGPVGDEGYSFAHDQGRKKMMENLGLSEDQVIIKESVPENADCEKALNDMVDQGCNVIFSTSYGFMDFTLNVAKQHPDVYFFHCSGYKTADNMSAYFGRMYEMRYLSGIAAGLKTKSNKIGYVAAMPLPEVTRGINAFTLGVRSVNPDATVEVKWTNSWFDPTGEKQAAVELLKSGCDVLGPHCDSAGPVVAAQEKGAWAVGYNADALSKGPDAYLTAPLWDWGIYYTEQVQKIIDGTWKSENYWGHGHMDEGIVKLDKLSANCAEGTEEAIQKAQEEIDNGKHVFAGPLKDNEGNVKVQEGATMTDEEMLSMDWFVEGVIGSVPKTES